MSAELKVYVRWFIYFLDLLWIRYNCAKFHHCRLCVTDFREGGPFWPPSLWAAPKKPILNRVKRGCILIVCKKVIINFVLINWLEKDHSMNETRRLKSIAIFSNLIKKDCMSCSGICIKKPWAACEKFLKLVSEIILFKVT